MIAYPSELEEKGRHLKQFMSTVCGELSFDARGYRALVLVSESLLIMMSSYRQNELGRIHSLIAVAAWEPLHFTASQRPKEELRKRLRWCEYCT